jgi:hypothetical protein
LKGRKELVDGFAGGKVAGLISRKAAALCKLELGIENQTFLALLVFVLVNLQPGYHQLLAGDTASAKCVYL